MSNGMWRASHVLGVQDVRKAAEYCRDVLAFSLRPVDGVFQPSPDEPGGVYAIVKRPGAWVHFQIRREAPPQRSRGGFERDAYSHVDDLDGLFEELEGRGARILHPPRKTPHGIREMDVEDLYGFRLSFGTLLGASA